MILGYERISVLTDFVLPVLFYLPWVAVVHFWLSKKEVSEKNPFWTRFHKQFVQGVVQPGLIQLAYISFGALVLEAIEAPVEEDANSDFAMCLEQFSRSAVDALAPAAPLPHRHPSGLRLAPWQMAPAAAEQRGVSAWRPCLFGMGAESTRRAA